MKFKLIKITILILASLTLVAAAYEDSSWENIENPLKNMELPALSPEQEGITQVEPIVIIGNLEVFDIDFTLAIEAISIASFDNTPLYPVLAGSVSGNLGIWWENKTAPDIINKYDWSQIIIAESDEVARTDILRFEDNIYNYAQLAKQINRRLVLLQGGDFISYPVEDFAN